MIWICWTLIRRFPASRWWFRAIHIAQKFVAGAVFSTLTLAALGRGDLGYLFRSRRWLLKNGNLPSNWSTSRKRFPDNRASRHGERILTTDFIGLRRRRQF